MHCTRRILDIIARISYESGSAGHPIRHPLRSEPTHVLQPRAAHGEVTDQIPNQRGELEDGRDEGEEGGVELVRSKKSQSAAFSFPFVFSFEKYVMHILHLQA